MGGRLKGVPRGDAGETRPPRIRPYPGFRIGIGVWPSARRFGLSSRMSHLADRVARDFDRCFDRFDRRDIAKDRESSLIFSTRRGSARAPARRDVRATGFTSAPRPNAAPPRAGRPRRFSSSSNRSGDGPSPSRVPSRRCSTQCCNKAHKRTIETHTPRMAGRVVRSAILRMLAKLPLQVASLAATSCV